MPSRILLIPNMPHWAMDKNARDIIKYNNSSLEFDVVYFREFMQVWKMYYEEYDLIFPMYSNLFLEFLKWGLPIDRVITGIRSFNSWDGGKTVPPGFNARTPRSLIRKLRRALLINTTCKKLWYIFSHYLPVVHTKYTCDIELFYPDKKGRSDKLIVGWTGSLTNHGPIRGVFDIIKPACNAVDGVELRIQDSESNWIIDDNRMREFYNSLDLYLCASSSESGPRPVLEAAACGVPSLTTDVGMVPELIENGVHGMIVERTVDAFIEKLNFCVNNRELLSEMGDEARKKMEREFNWANLIYQWTDFFKFSLELYRHLLE